MDQMVFAQTDRIPITRKISRLKAAWLWRPTNVSEIGVSLCFGIHESEKPRVSEMSMNNHLVV